ncbi:MAG: DUF3592 domain-containing protein [Lachnospiraceae bacterium]|nr:DUF3592 domain-containing protein [Lachnospiraceae bacterium]
MRYDPNYKDQIFREENGRIGLGEIIGMVKSEMNAPKTKMPPTRLSGLMKKVLPVMGVMLALVALITFVLTKSPVYTIVITMCWLFIFFGIVLLIIALYSFVCVPKQCTDVVEAMCIGHSISGGGNGARPLHSPVFQYEYRGRTYVAFDGLYENNPKMPPVGFSVNIRVNPMDPEELIWDFSRQRLIWFLLGTVIALTVGVMFFYVALVDEDFRSQVIYGEKTEESAAPEAAPVQKQSEDGRSLIDDDWITEHYLKGDAGAQWKIGIRKVEEVTKEEGKLGLVFEADEKYSYDGVWMKEEGLSGTVRNAAAGDEFYYIETEDGGTALSTKEYLYEGSRLNK